MILILLLTVVFFSYAQEKTSIQISGHITNNYVDIYKEITKSYTGDWQKYGQTFTVLQSKYFKQIYFWILILIPIVFLLHYFIIGPKKFSHEGENFLVYRVLTRLVHWIAAISFSILVISGLIIIFGKYFGGGSFVRNIRYIHAPAAVVFTPFALIMFLMWLKDMIFVPSDISWFLKFGGYLSKKNVIMNSGKFNPGQKMWFWLATIGGFIMAYTGRYLLRLSAPIDDLRYYVILHNFLGMALVAMFMVHLYMSVFAIKGSLKSMLTGRKSEEELKIMHCKYFKKLTNKDNCEN
jgi:formate dehydrogenase subunit gamma